MKKLELKNDDFLGFVKHLRHACRGIVVHEGKVLLGYEENNNKNYNDCSLYYFYSIFHNLRN